jgi:hypothetical protein
MQGSLAALAAWLLHHISSCCPAWNAVDKAVSAAYTSDIPIDTTAAEEYLEARSRIWMHPYKAALPRPSEPISAHTPQRPGHNPPVAAV